MNLTRLEFDILRQMEKNTATMTQRTLAAVMDKSLGSINKAISTLNERSYIKSRRISADGLSALEPYRVKRAIFIAAGFGSRLVPITLNTPKPLVRIKGKRIIDTLLDAVTAVGIEEIIIVRGYLSEQFDQLLYKYPNIRFVENPNYNESNNISSAMCVRYMLGNAYVFDADLVLYNPNLIEKYQYVSNYLGVPVERTDDWCLLCKNGIINKMTVGGMNCHHMFGLSYWTERDGMKLAEHIRQAYEMPGGKERYWDQVALECFASEYSVEIRECSFNDIVEIDTFRELKQLDKTYDV